MSALPIRTMVDWLDEAGQLTADPVAVGTPMVDAVEGACVDSRLARPACLFVALPGERTDGHRYVDDAVQRGAVAALVAGSRLGAVRNQLYGSAVLIPVRDTRIALHAIAIQWRMRHPDLVRVGITGSNGKTTTKELIAAILSRSADTVFSRGNYNSDIGLPVEILRIRDHHRYGVFELGMNRPGEIRELTELVKPDIAVITNVGGAHIGMLGSRRRIAEEKKAIVSQFTGTQTAVIPASGEFARFLAADVTGTVVRYGRSSAGVLRIEQRGLDGSILHVRDGDILLRLAGEHMVANALAALTVARILGVPFEAVKAGVESVGPMFGRTQVINGRVRVLQDCYNANPESMAMALSLLAETPAAGRRVAILGSMKELGEETTAAHRAVVQRALSSSLDEVWLYGDEFAEAVGTDEPHVRIFGNDQWDELVRLSRELRDGDTVLIKGSRSLEMERLTPIIEQETFAASNGGSHG